MARTQRRVRSLSGVLASVLLCAGLTTALGGTAAAVGPTIGVTPASGSAGSSVSATGSGFPARVSGSVAFQGTATAYFKTAKNGAFSVRFIVPNVAPSSYTVSASAGGSTASSSFTVTSTTSTSTTSTSTTSTSTTSTSTTSTSTTSTSTTSTSTTSPPVASNTTPTHFSMLRPGSALPSDSICASEVHAVATATSEPRPDNTTPNHTVPPAGSFSFRAMNSSYGYDNQAQNLEARVDGNFVGTTDQIIQWAACKWGWDEDVVRAIAVQESNWHQSQLGDFASTGCPPGYSAPCPYSFGIHQMKWTSDPQGNFPWSRDSTAFNLDLSMMVHRVCYEGYTQWLTNSTTTYAAGDMWGCVGEWYSGGWHDAGAQSYISDVQTALANHPWTSASF